MRTSTASSEGFAEAADARGTERTMSIHPSKYPINRLALWRQDISMIAAFVVWAIILGFLPVLVIGALIAT
jgi:hypothetical protein